MSCAADLLHYLSGFVHFAHTLRRRKAHLFDEQGQSTPKFLTASIRLPGAGFRRRHSARAASCGVKARNSFTP